MFKIRCNRSNRADFYPRPPRGGRLQRLSKNAACDQISIHALREEGDLPVLLHPRIPKDFYPRPPRGGRRRRPSVLCRSGNISIHALREEGDRRCARCCSCPSRISIHALREEGDA